MVKRMVYTLIVFVPMAMFTLCAWPTFRMVADIHDMQGKVDVLSRDLEATQKMEKENREHLQEVADEVASLRSLIGGDIDQ
jgi:hypothetical protein